MNRAPRGERRRDRCASAGRRSRLERRWPRAAAWARPPFASWCSVHRVSFGVLGHGGRALMIAEELGCQNAQGVQRASAKNGRRRGTLPDLRRPDEIICTICTVLYILYSTVYDGSHLI